MKFRVSEYFYSIQGEGRFVGTPSVFLRLFGCNFTCGGFGMPVGEKSQERFGVNPLNFLKFEDLPLVKTGCDSYSSWDPRFKKFAKHFTVEEMAEALVDITPYKSWETPEHGSNVHLVITGGEPLLGWQKLYPALFDYMARKHFLLSVTFETNGTQELTSEFKKYLSSQTEVEITFSVSPKLSASGEIWEDAIKPDIVGLYSVYGDTYLKFVVNPSTPIDEIERAVNAFYHGENRIRDYDVFLMPVGGTTDSYFENNRAVAKMAMERGWRYSPRLHVDLFGNSWGT